jgi:hypothetical protein
LGNVSTPTPIASRWLRTSPHRHNDIKSDQSRTPHQVRHLDFAAPRRGRPSGYTKPATARARVTSLCLAATGPVRTPSHPAHFLRFTFSAPCPRPRCPCLSLCLLLLSLPSPQFAFTPRLLVRLRRVHRLVLASPNPACFLLWQQLRSACTCCFPSCTCFLFCLTSTLYASRLWDNRATHTTAIRHAPGTGPPHTLLPIAPALRGAAWTEPAPEAVERAGPNADQNAPALLVTLGRHIAPGGPVDFFSPSGSVDFAIHDRRRHERACTSIRSCLLWLESTFFAFPSGVARRPYNHPARAPTVGASHVLPSPSVSVSCLSVLLGLLLSALLVFCHTLSPPSSFSLSFALSLSLFLSLSPSQRNPLFSPPT